MGLRGGLAASIGGVCAADSVDTESEIVGPHATETIDLVKIVSGEIYAITEPGEMLMRPGDALVQRGTKHAWSKLGIVPCTLSAVHRAATR